jgi:hypothetical protein
MDLSNPMMSDEDKETINNIIRDSELPYYPEIFTKMHQEDRLESLIRNVEFWLKDTFQDLLENN